MKKLTLTALAVLSMAGAMAQNVAVVNGKPVPTARVKRSSSRSNVRAARSRPT